MKKVIYLFALLLLAASCGRPTAETKVLRRDITELVFASGTLEAEDQYFLTAQTEGYLVALHFKEGDLVQRDQLLAVIDNSQNTINANASSQIHDIVRQNTDANAPNLLQLEASIKTAKERVKEDKLQVERYQRLYNQQSVSKLELENVQLALVNSEANLSSLQQQQRSILSSNKQTELQQRSVKEISKVGSDMNKLKAIVGGKVYEKRKQLGDYVRRGDIIAVIANPDMIYAELNVDESNMAKLKLQQTAMVRLNTNKDKAYVAHLAEILPSFDKQTQSFLVKAYFREKPDFNLMGTQLEANIIIGQKKNALVIPRNYLGYGNKVMLDKNKWIQVKPGIVSNEWVEILSGLKANQTIKTEQVK